MSATDHHFDVLKSREDLIMNITLLDIVYREFSLSLRLDNRLRKHKLATPPST